MDISKDFLNALKTSLLLEEVPVFDNLTLHMIQRYPQLLTYSYEFQLKTTPNSPLDHYLNTYQQQKYVGSGLFRHCLTCQHKTKVVEIDNWACSNTQCKQHIIRVDN